MLFLRSNWWSLSTRLKWPFLFISTGNTLLSTEKLLGVETPLLEVFSLYFCLIIQFLLGFSVLSNGVDHHVEFHLLIWSDHQVVIIRIFWPCQQMCRTNLIDSTISTAFFSITICVRYSPHNANSLINLIPWLTVRMRLTVTKWDPLRSLAHYWILFVGQGSWVVIFFCRVVNEFSIWVFTWTSPCGSIFFVECLECWLRSETDSLFWSFVTLLVRWLKVYIYWTIWWCWCWSWRCFLHLFLFFFIHKFHVWIIVNEHSQFVSTRLLLIKLLQELPICLKHGFEVLLSIVLPSSLHW